MWFIGVEVDQETSASPPKKNPGSAPESTPSYLSPVQPTITPESTPSHADVLIEPRHVSLPLEFNRSFQQIFVEQERVTHEAL